MRARFGEMERSSRATSRWLWLGSGWPEETGPRAPAAGGDAVSLQLCSGGCGSRNWDRRAQVEGLEARRPIGPGGGWPERGGQHAGGWRW